MLNFSSTLLIGSVFNMEQIAQMAMFDGCTRTEVQCGSPAVNQALTLRFTMHGQGLMELTR